MKQWDSVCDVCGNALCWMIIYIIHQLYVACWVHTIIHHINYGQCSVGSVPEKVCVDIIYILRMTGMCIKDRMALESYGSWANYHAWYLNQVPHDPSTIRLLLYANITHVVVQVCSHGVSSPHCGIHMCFHIHWMIIYICQSLFYIYIYAYVL